MAMVDSQHQARISAHGEPDHMGFIDAKVIQQMDAIAKQGLPAVLAGFSGDVGRKIAARRGYDAAVAARKVTDLIRPSACIATELVQEQDRLPGASVFEEKLYAVTFGIGQSASLRPS